MGKRKILAVFLIVFSVMLSSFAFYGHQVIYTPNVLVDAQEDRILTIPKGMTFETLQNKLYDDRYVNDLVSFSLVAKILNYDDGVQPGHYTLTPNMTNVRLVKFLKAGNPPVRVPFNSARRLGDLINHFEKYLAVDSAEFMQHVALEDVQAKYGFDEANMISMFLPDTYEFFYKSSPEVILNKMKAAYDQFWTEERLQKAKNIGLTPQQVSVLASIVRGETAKMDEAPKIAGLYKNRLDIGMRLQADPTLVFANEDFTIRRVKKGDREIDSPYNTYKYKGLPPGPINMPTKAYLDAVLNLENHDHIYMVADASFNGYHVFSKDYDEHLKNARKLWRALNKREIDR